MGEYEPEDSRNITSTAPDGRWTNKDGKPPIGVPDEQPADAKEATVRKDEIHVESQPTISDEPPIPGREDLPGTPRPG